MDGSDRKIVEYDPEQQKSGAKEKHRDNPIFFFPDSPLPGTDSTLSLDHVNRSLSL